MTRQISYKKRGLIRYDQPGTVTSGSGQIAEGGTTTTVLSYKNMPLILTVNRTTFTPLWGQR